MAPNAGSYNTASFPLALTITSQEGKSNVGIRFQGLPSLSWVPSRCLFPSSSLFPSFQLHKINKEATTPRSIVDTRYLVPSLRHQLIIPQSSTSTPITTYLLRITSSSTKARLHHVKHCSHRLESLSREYAMLLGNQDTPCLLTINT